MRATFKEEAEGRDKLKAELEKIARYDFEGNEENITEGPGITEPAVPGIRDMPVG